MLRLILGIIKGAVVGAAVGFGAMKLGLGAGLTGWLVYGAVGFVVGLVCGKALWRQETLWTPVLKGVFGALVSAGLFWGARKLLGGMVLPWNAQVGAAPDAPWAAVPAFLGPVIGAVYGAFVEVDDGGKAEAKKEKA